MTWHGQFDPPTDQVAFEYFPTSYRGSLIDVGAYDGEIISNTKAFEDAGWLCLCIEPNPEFWPALTRKRKHCQQYAVGSASGRGTLMIFKGPATSHEAISALTPDPRLVAQYQAEPDGSVEVEIRTLDQCIAEFGRFQRIDMVSIDTEGTELDVLKGFSIKQWTPKLIIVENNFADASIRDYMQAQGYRLAQVLVVNEFYVPLNG